MSPVSSFLRGDASAAASSSSSSSLRNRTQESSAVRYVCMAITSTGCPSLPGASGACTGLTAWPGDVTGASVLGLGLAGGLAEGGLEPLRVAGLPRAVGAHPLEHAVDEPDHVDLVQRDADAVRLLGEGRLVEDDGVRVLRRQAGEHGVVAGDRVDLALLEQHQAAGVVVGADRLGVRGEPDQVVHAGRTERGADPVPGQGGQPGDVGALADQDLLAGLVVLRREARWTSSGRR